jgi:transposase-like protein
MKYAKEDKRPDVIEVDYVCDWCGYKFTQKVRKKVGHDLGTDKIAKHKGNQSDSVRCPQCKKFIKTWS